MTADVLMNGMAVPVVFCAYTQVQTVLTNELTRFGRFDDANFVEAYSCGSSGKTKQHMVQNLLAEDVRGGVITDTKLLWLPPGTCPCSYDDCGDK